VRPTTNLFEGQPYDDDKIAERSHDRGHAEHCDVKTGYDRLTTVQRLGDVAGTVRDRRKVQRKFHRLSVSITTGESVISFRVDYEKYVGILRYRHYNETATNNPCYSMQKQLEFGQNEDRTEPVRDARQRISCSSSRELTATSLDSAERSALQCDTLRLEDGQLQQKYSVD